MSDDITPRVLVEYVLKTRDGEIDHKAYEAINANGTLNGGKFHEENCLGYAEFEPHTRISRYTNKSEFVETIREKSEYCHLKE
jgi:hypothetical protein